LNSVKKGDLLEDKFYEYLLDQQRRGELVYDVESPETCKIFKKKKYFCMEREADVEFDIVIEIYRKNSDEPFYRIIFECKNYNANIPESCVTDFSDKIGRIFKHGAKGVMVVSSGLQSGADNIARKRSMGIAKFDETGLQVLAERLGGSYLEEKFVKNQIFRNTHANKPLKFSALYDGKFYSDITQFIFSLLPGYNDKIKRTDTDTNNKIQYLSSVQIEQSAQELLDSVGYQSGAVDLERICSVLKIFLEYTNKNIENEFGMSILGTANFDHKLIIINQHSNKFRERFTLGHEIGHFYLNHGRYLRSETIVERDLFISTDDVNLFNYERLEFQANAFASNLILPNSIFRRALHVARKHLDIKDRGHGYVFVDSQPCNYLVYDRLLTYLSVYFEVSKQVIEIRLKKLGLLTDQRDKFPSSFSTIMMRNIMGPVEA
jgi:Zn-dependent peptidase ImmA (M78 family)